MKLRFSLRGLLVIVTFVVAFCVWRDRPRRVAEQFVEAIDACRYAAADEMFIEPERQFVVQFMERDERNRISAEVALPTVGEWLRGVCPIAVRSEDFAGLGGTVEVQVLATARGLAGLRGEEFTIADHTFPGITPVMQRR